MDNCKMVGMLSGGKWDKSIDKNRRVYSTNGLSPTLTTCGGGNQEVKIAEPCIAAIRGRNMDNPTSRESGLPTQQMLEIKSDGTSNTLTTVQKDNMVIEPNVLTPKRTEFGKSIRKAYENGVADLSRHAMTEMKPRADGISNTLTTVQKDNYVAEPIGFYDDGEPIYSESDEWTMEQARRGADRTNGYVGFRIRKLTPRECWRLMGFHDTDFDKAQDVNSNSQLYKQAGNSIVVDVLMAIFKEML